MLKQALDLVKYSIVTLCNEPYATHLNKYIPSWGLFKLNINVSFQIYFTIRLIRAEKALINSLDNEII